MYHSEDFQSSALPTELPGLNQNFQTVAGCILTVALLRVASTYLRAVPHDLLQLLDRTAVQDPLTRERMPRGLVPRQGRKSARGLGAPLQEPPQ